MFSICVPALRRWELHQAVNVCGAGGRVRGGPRNEGQGQRETPRMRGEREWGARGAPSPQGMGPTGNGPTDPSGNEPIDPTGNEPIDPTGTDPPVIEPTGNDPTDPTGNDPIDPTGTDP